MQRRRWGERRLELRQHDHLEHVDHHGEHIYVDGLVDELGQHERLDYQRHLEQQQRDDDLDECDRLHEQRIVGQRRMSSPDADLGELADGLEPFELELFGGGIERRYRRMRPEVEELPWASFHPTLYSDDVLVSVRSSWTRAAFQEHRTAVACTAALRAMIEARAPIDLVAVATRFPLDEMVHVELCARMAMLAGGGSEIRHDPDDLIAPPPAGLSPLMRAADIVMRVYCVGEALSIPLLRGTWHAAKHPLPKAILSRIVRDEAAHGVFGFSFMDWALPDLGTRDLEVLGDAADRAIRSIHTLWAEIEKEPPRADSEANPLGWMRTDEYLSLAERSMQTKVVEPLEARGIPLRAPSEWVRSRRPQR